MNISNKSMYLVGYIFIYIKIILECFFFVIIWRLKLCMKL